MKVTTISATIRFSKDIGGSWKSVELAAEASISDREFWKQAQSELYYQLGDQLRQLWHNGNGAALNGAGGVESRGQPLPTSEPAQTPRPHWCEEHQAEFKRRQKAGVVWYSHRHGKGWCSEPETAERR